jgi:hypothetical protein
MPVKEDPPEERKTQALDAGDIALLKSYVRAPPWLFLFLFFFVRFPCDGWTPTVVGPFSFFFFCQYAIAVIFCLFFFSGLGFSIMLFFIKNGTIC